jgi:glycosyltransferase involved in cell wall biosynthesis
MARDQPSSGAGSGVTHDALLTLERIDPRADVLVVTSGWPNEDNQTYCIFIKRQMESLIERGLRCDVLFIRGYRSALAYPLAALRLAVWSLTRGPSRYRLVHAHSGEAALAAAFFWRAPLLVSYLGDDLLGTPRADGVVPILGRFRRAIFRQHSRLAARTITKSREMQAALPGRVRARNVVLPNGVDTDLFRPIDRAEARRELGWDANVKVALFAADPEVPRKRYWLAENGVELARSLIPDLRLEVARGVLPVRMPLLMNAADCLLLTSSIEGSPNVVKEARMCNLPVIATPAGDVAELLDGVRASYVCRPSAPALAEALVKCLREARRSNGRQASRRLDARTVAVSLLHIYKEITPKLHFEIHDEAGTGERQVADLALESDRLQR